MDRTNEAHPFRGPSTTSLMMVILESPSVSEIRGTLGRKTTPEETDTIINKLQLEQESLKVLIEEMGGEIIGQYQFAVDGIKVRINTEKVDCLKTLPNVREVLPVGTYNIQ